MYSGGMNVLSRSSTDRPLLVCLHPIGLNGGLWEEFVPHLQQRHRVISIDLPGHGKASPLCSEWTVAAIADAVERELKGTGEDYTLLGASLGGMVAQVLALRRLPNLRRLILADTLSAVTAKQQEVLVGRAHSVREGGMSALLDETIRRWFTADFIRDRGAIAMRVKAILAACNPEFHASCWEAIASFNIENEISEIRVPVLTIVGSEDTSTPPYIAQAIAERVYDGRCQIIPDAAHMSMIEQPEVFASMVAGFIAGRDE